MVKNDESKSRDEAQIFKDQAVFRSKSSTYEEK